MVCPRSSSRAPLSRVLCALATLLVVAVTIALVPCPARAAAEPAAVAGAKAALQAAVNTGDPPAMLAARAKFAALSAAEPDDAALHYWVALAAWRAVPRLMGDEAKKEQAKKVCKDAIEQCDRALALAPKHADAMALKAGLQGLWLSFEPAAMMTLGMQMEQGLARAHELEPANPRVTFLDGVNTLHKPAFVGGGAEKALAKFEQSIALYERAAATPTGAPGDAATLAWGHDDALTWAGRAAVQAKQYDAARAYYRRALEINPANGWVRGSLLPQVEKLVAEKGRS